MNQLPTIRKRTAGKFASTTYVNEVADAVTGTIDYGPSGQPPSRHHHFPGVVVVINAAASGNGAYTGDIIGGEMDGDESSDFTFPQGMGRVGGMPCIIFDAPESGRPSHRLPVGFTIPGMIVGYSTDGFTPLVLIRADILSDKRVTVTKVGGTDGNDTTPPSYTYDVTDFDGVQLNTAPVTPLMQRRNGSFVEAAIGIGREQSASPGFALAWVDEVPVTDNCEATSLSEFYTY